MALSTGEGVMDHVRRVFRGRMFTSEMVACYEECWRSDRKAVSNIFEDDAARAFRADNAYAVGVQRRLDQFYGNMVQVLLGSLPGWEDLQTGHETECDLLHRQLGIVIELKNAHNTLNSASTAGTNLKLAKAMKCEGVNRAIIGIVHPKRGFDTPSTQRVQPKFERLEGIALFKLICTLDGTDYTNDVIEVGKQVLAELRAQKKRD